MVKNKEVLKGVYYLKKYDKIVYVGCSINVHRRIQQHTEKDFDTVEYTECKTMTRSELYQFESSEIKKYDPLYNKAQGAPKKYAKRVTIQHSIESTTLDKIDKLAEVNTTRTDLINEYIRKGLGLATILIMVTLASCNKEPQTFCYECETIETTQPKTIVNEWCNWTEQDAENYEDDLTYTQPNGDNYVTTCKKK